MSAILIAPLVVLGPLLNGAWDLWAQALLELAVLAGAAVWFWRGVARGSVPLPAGALMGWAGGLAIWGALAAFLGPLPAYAVPAWFVWMAGLGTILFASVMSGEERRRLERAIRMVAWLVSLLAVYQHFAEGRSQPAASLLNENAFAGAALIFLSLAAAGGDWLLCGFLVLCLAWTRSAGAWVGLVAGLWFVRRRSLAWRVLFAGAWAVSLALVFFKWGSHDIGTRWLWWTAAGRMIWTHPWFGFGPGTFAYACIAYIHPTRLLNSLYAHQYYLETAAEQGVPFLAVWLGGIALFLWRGGGEAGFKRAGLVAVLVQSFWDYSLSIPAIFWLFCYCLGSMAPADRYVLSVPSRWKLPAAALVAGLCGFAGWSVFRPWQAERLRIRAEKTALSSGELSTAAALLERSARLFDHPETARSAGEIELIKARHEESAERLWSAAADFEHAVARNPYRASTWILLENTYRELGRNDLARASRRSAAGTCPELRGP